MFGDKLSQEQCKRLVGRLKECRQPFVCAHGRPSLIPLCVLAGNCDAVTEQAGETVMRQIDWERWKERSHKR